MSLKERVDVEEVDVTPLISDERARDDSWPVNNKGVLVIYSGGTIGSAPRDRSDPESPQIVVSWEELKRAVPGMTDLKFRIDAVSFKEALDSANVGPRHWKTLAHIIERHYNDYDGFVIAHGTDTMVYTASVLSFMLQNLGKPVIVTGAQISAIGKVRNDAQQNLITSLLIANPSYSKVHLVPEVCIFFRDKLIRGNRARKVDASGFTAFDSPNCRPLATAGDKITVDEDIVRIPPPDGVSLEVRADLDTNVIPFDIFPGLQDNTTLLETILQTELDKPKLRGAILKTYGAGNVPTEPSRLVNVIKKAVDKGVVIVNVTQCIKGDVEQGLYDTSAVLQDIGVISGQEITPEAALCKLMELLGEPDLHDDIPTIKKMMTKNLAGELDHSISYTTLDMKGGVIGPNEAEQRHRLPGNIPFEGFTGPNDVEKLLIRLVGGQVLELEKVKVAVYANLGPRDDPEQHADRLLGVFTKEREVVPQTFTFDVTKAASAIKQEGLSFTIILRGGIGKLKWDRVEVALMSKQSRKTLR